jgi:predicted membrane-bound spermidine synthase
MGYFFPIFLMVFPASFILGGGLPVLDRIAIKSPQVAGRRVGDIHLANIVGSIFGSLFISFWMLPTLGSEWTYTTLALLALTFPILYFTGKFKRTGSLHSDPVSVSVMGALILTLILLPGKGQFYSTLFEAGSEDQSVILETSDSVLTLTLDSKSQAPNMLWIGGEVNSLYPSDSTYESRALMCVGASRPKRILVIGMGGGIAARFFQSMESVEELSSWSLWKASMPC